jgi:hypothetical protein
MAAPKEHKFTAYGWFTCLWILLVPFQFGWHISVCPCLPALRYPMLTPQPGPPGAQPTPGRPQLRRRPPALAHGRPPAARLHPHVRRRLLRPSPPVRHGPPLTLRRSRSPPSSASAGSSAASRPTAQCPAGAAAARRARAPCSSAPARPPWASRRGCPCSFSAGTQLRQPDGVTLTGASAHTPDSSSASARAA